MPNDNINAKSTDRGNNSGQIGQGSQAAVRQENNALHHKYRNTPQPNGSGENNDQRSQAAAQLNNVDIEQDEDQAEIPKVGSRDAPGG